MDLKPGDRLDQLFWIVMTATAVGAFAWILHTLSQLP
jgi:hypothetical protein